MSDINCPYCDVELEINHDDGAGYEEDVREEMCCYSCEKQFVFSTSVSYHYEAEKADCLNDKEHQFEITHTSPKVFSRMRCNDCDIEREPTEKERIKYKLGTREDYFASLDLENK